MKTIAVLLVLAAAVAGRPDNGQRRFRESEEAKEPDSAQNSASLPWRRLRELYGELGAEIPVQLVYEDETEGRSRRRRKRSILGGQPQPQEHQGPSIVKLKVRRGGVAIAGPGGVATAGSGGTAIVGPGGTAYTTPDGTAVVGPGGRLIELSPYVVKGRSAGRLIATGPVVYYPLQHYHQPTSYSLPAMPEVRTRQKQDLHSDFLKFAGQNFFLNSEDAL